MVHGAEQVELSPLDGAVTPSPRGKGKWKWVTDNDRLVFMRWFENHDDADGQWPCIRSRPLSR